MVRFLDLRLNDRKMRAEIDLAIAKVVDDAAFVLGPAVAKFEERFAVFCGTDHCVAVNSGASALHLAMRAAGIGPGDEVITVSMTFVATAAAILYCGAKPVFVDVDPDTWTMDPAQIESAISHRTKAILPVHLHGLMADMDPIRAIAQRHGLLVIEDAAQAHGAEYHGARAGSLGAIGCFSFYPGKNLGAFGEAGAIVTNDADLAQRVRLLRDWGQDGKYNHVLPGFNARMDGIQGAVLGVKLGYLEAATEARRSVAALYDQHLSRFGQKRPAPPRERRHVYHVYSVELEDRDAVQHLLHEAGIGTGIHYPVPVHRQKAYADLGYQPGDLPITERLAERFLSLPMYPGLAPRQVEHVARLLEAAVADKEAGAASPQSLGRIDAEPAIA